jgi:hypothetical protein
MIFRTLLLSAIFGAFVSLPFQSQAQAQITDASIITDSRYDRIDQNKTGQNFQNRGQGRIRIGFTYNVAGYFEVVGLASSGPSDNNDWFTFYDANTGKPEKGTLALRQLYLKKAFGKDKSVSAEIGSFGGFTTIGAGGLGATANSIMGVRFNQKSEFGTLKVTVGGLDGFNAPAVPSNPDVFTRKLQVNFMEVELDRQVAEKIMLHTAYMHLADESGSLKGDDFAREQIVFSPDILGAGIVNVLGDVVYDFQKKAASYEVGLDLDIGGAINPKLKNYVKLDAYYGELAAELNALNTQNNAWYQNGKMVTVKMSGAFGKNGRYGWMLRRSMGLGEPGSLGDRNRTDGVFTVKIGK